MTKISKRSNHLDQLLLNRLNKNQHSLFNRKIPHYHQLTTSKNQRLKGKLPTRKRFGFNQPLPNIKSPPIKHPRTKTWLPRWETSLWATRRKENRRQTMKFSSNPSNKWSTWKLCWPKSMSWICSKHNLFKTRSTLRRRDSSKDWSMPKKHTPRNSKLWTSSTKSSHSLRNSRRRWTSKIENSSRV